MSDEEIKVFIDGVVRYFERVTGEKAEVDLPYLKGEDSVTLDFTGVIGISGRHRGAVYFTSGAEQLTELLRRLGETEVGSSDHEDLVGEVANTIAGTMAVAAIMITCWQLYLGNSLRTEISYWTQRIKENQAQAEELKVLTRTLGDQTAKLDQAYGLVSAPYLLSDLVMAFGRTRLDRMSIESLNGFTGGVVLRGALRVVFWGAMAMGAAALIGRLFHVQVG